MLLPDPRNAGKRTARHAPVQPRSPRRPFFMPQYWVGVGSPFLQACAPPPRPLPTSPYLSHAFLPCAWVDPRSLARHQSIVPPVALGEVPPGVSAWGKGGTSKRGTRMFTPHGSWFCENREAHVSPVLFPPPSPSARGRRGPRSARASRRKDLVIDAVVPVTKYLGLRAQAAPPPCGAGDAFCLASSPLLSVSAGLRLEQHAALGTAIERRSNSGPLFPETHTAAPFLTVPMRRGREHTDTSRFSTSPANAAPTGAHRRRPGSRRASRRAARPRSTARGGTTTSSSAARRRASIRSRASRRAWLWVKLGGALSRLDGFAGSGGSRVVLMRNDGLRRFLRDWHHVIARYFNMFRTGTIYASMLCIWCMEVLDDT